MVAKQVLMHTITDFPADLNQVLQPILDQRLALPAGKLASIAHTLDTVLAPYRTSR
jgi:hypothetical protein